MKAEEFFKHMTGIRVKSEYRIGTDGCVELMEQYAKEQAVEFAEKYGLEISLASNRPFIEDLYDQFKQQSQNTE